MSSLFRKDKTRSKGRYREVQQESDSDISLTDEEKDVFKKTGAIELNLYPQTKIVRTKVKPSCCQYIAVCGAIAVLMAAVGAVVVVFWKNHGHSKMQVSSGSSKDDEFSMSTALPDDNGNWNITLRYSASEGSVQLMDVDGDGLDDIIFASSIGEVNNIHMGDPKMIQFKGLQQACTDIGKTYPCLGKVTALRGLDGKHLWSINTRSGAFVMNCEQFDINKDGKMDCIATGRLALIAAFDPHAGEVLWTCEDDKFVNASWDTYQAARLPDWDHDGVPEILLANGGDVSYQPEEHDRVPGRLLVLSGATGRPLGHRYLNMPDRKETYMSPIIYTPGVDKPSYILFGSGGETVPGNLMGISLRDFCKYILGDSAAECLEQKETHYTNLTTDGSMKEIFIIYKGSSKGVMVPPVIADVNNDGTLDIMMTSFEGQNVLFSGEDLSAMWTAEFPGMETYSTPSPGYFDDDEYLDFMIHWNLGRWMSYFNSTVCVISGKDGSILWSLYSNYMKMSSPISIQSAHGKGSAYLFSTIARDSKFSWTKDGVVKHKAGRKRRHMGDKSSPPDSLTPVAFRKEMFKKNINCEDDLSTFAEEVFVVDSTNLKNPVKILHVPTEKHHYDANPTCSEHIFFPGTEGLPQSPDENQFPDLESGNQMSPSGSESQPPPLVGGNQQPLSGSESQPPPLERGNLQPPSGSERQPPPLEGENQQPPSGSESQPPPLERGNLQPPSGSESQPPPLERGNLQPPSGSERQPPPLEGVNQQPLSGSESQLLPSSKSNDDAQRTYGGHTPGKSIDDNPESIKDKGTTYTNGEDTNSAGVASAARPPNDKPRKKRHEEDTKQMCVVEIPDGMSSGVIGDVDGDGLLDYVSVLAPEMMEFDAEYCQQGMSSYIVVRKVSMEKGILAGKFPHVPVKAQTSLQEKDDGSIRNNESKLFAPISQQKWTHYMGAKGNNHFR